jgi:hypothetical protein
VEYSSSLHYRAFGREPRLGHGAAIANPTFDEGELGERASYVMTSNSLGAQSLRWAFSTARATAPLVL